MRLHLVCAPARPCRPGASVLGWGCPAGGSVTPSRATPAQSGPTFCLQDASLDRADTITVAAEKSSSRRSRIRLKFICGGDCVSVRPPSAPLPSDGSPRTHHHGQDPRTGHHGQVTVDAAGHADRSPRTHHHGQDPRTGHRRRVTADGSSRTGHREQVTADQSPRAWMPATALGNVLSPQQARLTHLPGIQLDLTWASDCGHKTPPPPPPPPAFAPTLRVTANTAGTGRRQRPRPTAGRPRESTPA